MFSLCFDFIVILVISHFSFEGGNLGSDCISSWSLLIAYSLYTLALVFVLQILPCGTVPPPPRVPTNIFLYRLQNMRTHLTAKDMLILVGGRATRKLLFYVLYVHYKKWPFWPENKAVHLLEWKQ